MRFQGGPGTVSPERINYLGVTLKMLIQRAYDVKPEQVVGPDWVATQRYTITAKLPPKTTLEQSRLMLQSLLNERFQMRLHREPRSFHVYELLVSKHGLKLKPVETLPLVTDAEERRKAASSGLAAAGTAIRERLDFQPTDWFRLSSATMARLVERLSQYLDRPIIDRTHLDGRYEFILGWEHDWVKPKEDMPQGPSIFAALKEQLGLELKSATDQLQVLVIDGAERIPTEN
jgi:uncharacterized protein (TIGR03435 family)